MNVSVIMPMRNAGRHLREAVESVLADAHVQSLIVVDDGSTDDSRLVLKEFRDARIHVVDGPQRGIAAAFNRGLAEVGTELVVRCDADDLFDAARLGWQIDFFQKHPEFAAICGSFSMIDDDGRHIRTLDCGAAAADITDELLGGVTRTSLCTWLIRTDALRRAGGCREYFVSAEDIDLQLRLAEIGRVGYEPRHCYSYRIHGESVTHTQQRHLKAFFEKTAREMAQERRRNGQDALQLGRPPEAPAAGESERLSASEHTQAVLLGEAWRKRLSGDRKGGLRTALRACLAHPGSLRAWRSLGAMVIRRYPQ